MVQKKHYNTIIAIVAIFLIVSLTIFFNNKVEKPQITDTQEESLAGKAFTSQYVQGDDRKVSVKPSTKCIDSDKSYLRDGTDYKVKGKCVDSNGEYIDSCETATRVKEYICTELKECVPIITNCLPDYGNKCEDGACLFVTRS